MRETEAGWALHTSSGAWMRVLRLAAVALGISLVMSATAASAQDDNDDDMTFEQKAIKQIMTGLGGTNMDNTGIDYRERSPLVVPPKLDLPPPDTDASTASVPNWPKDPDVQARRARRAEAKTDTPLTAYDSARPLTPAEMAPKRARTSSSAATDNNTPGNPYNNIILSPSQLGVSSGMFKNVFGGNKSESAKFTGEPKREELTQPPPGYQTPSPDYAYGTGPKDVMRNEGNLNPMTGKY